MGGWHVERDFDRGIVAHERPGGRLKRALAAFGLTLDEPRIAAGPRDAAGAAVTLDERLSPGDLALVTGPSGAGKSTLLRAVAAIAHQRGELVLDARDLPPDHDRRPIVELFHAPPEGDSGSMRLLASVGLGDARLMPRPAGGLSDGQRARLGIALALDRAQAEGGRALIVIDELASGVDTLAAEGLCAGLRRALVRSDARRRLRIVCATTRDDLLAHLDPDVCVRLDAAGVASFDEAPRVPVRDELHVEVGTIEDYHALSRWHYRAGAPAVPRRVLRAVHEREGLIGVLVTAMPTLNARWRSLVWPGRYEGLTPRERATRLNADLRCIARVVVDPRVRATGVATRLVRAYLAKPETPGTEALAAMGAACPMFSRAGMREYLLPPAPADARLLDALERLGLGPDDLVDVPEASARVRACPLATRELRVWANASRATRGAGEGIDELVRLAAGRVGCRPRVYAAVQHSGGEP